MLHRKHESWNDKDKFLKSLGKVKENDSIFADKRLV